MFTRHVFCAILSLSFILNFCSSETTEMELADVQAQEDNARKELMNQIRLEKFDRVLPEVMRENNIDMWIHVVRGAIPDPFGAEHLGSTSGVFIFTDRSGDRIERAVLGIRWRQGPTISGRASSLTHKLVEECGAYDIIGETTFQREMPGGPETQYDHRFKGVGEFVAERDPKRIAVNYRDELGPLVGTPSRDGISHTDYNLLVKAIGNKYARRIVSSEHLTKEYLARPVPSESNWAESAATERETTRPWERDYDIHKDPLNQIRREEFDLLLPQAMRKNTIDMWIHVLRKSNPDPLADVFGSTSGIYIFTDRGGDRIERAVLGLRWRGTDSDAIEESGDYDIVGETIDRGEMPGGPESEYDHRFKGVGEFVAERDPKRIAVNYWDELGPPMDDSGWNDGISHTDYNLLVKAVGDKYAEKIVSAEYLRVDYLAEAVPGKIELDKRIYKDRYESIDRDFAKIVPGVTKNSDLESRATAMKPERIFTPADYVFQRGDLIQIDARYAYVLREGETELPPELAKIWADSWKIRKVMEDNIKVGRTAGETYEILNQKLAETGIISNDRQQYYKDLDPEKTQVGIDAHCLQEDPYPARIGPFGPDWMRDWTIPPVHHFTTEYFVYMALPSSKHQVKYLNLWFHDPAYVTEYGVEYIYPPQKEPYYIQ